MSKTSWAMVLSAFTTYCAIHADWEGAESGNILLAALATLGMVGILLLVIFDSSNK